MSKTKARGHGGRPSNRELWDRQQRELDQLRRLLVRRRLNDDTWRVVAHLLQVIADLEDMSTPMRAATYDGDRVMGKELPIFPGVQVTPTGLRHGGTYAEELNAWIHRHLEWVVSTVERRYKGREPDPKPREPRTPRRQDVVT